MYAHREETPQHERALEALRELAEGNAAWGLPVFVVGEFLRVVTHPRIHASPSTEGQALRVVDEVLQSPSVRLLRPGTRYMGLLRDVILDAGARGNLVIDAQIAAVCLEQGADTILTEDRDFRRFSGITVRSLL